MIDIEEYTEEQILRAKAITKAGNPLRRVKHGTLGNSAKVFLNADESVITYQSQHWSPTMVADHPKDGSFWFIVFSQWINFLIHIISLQCPFRKS